jgi:hypothetical protein
MVSLGISAKSLTASPTRLSMGIQAAQYNDVSIRSKNE